MLGVGAIIPDYHFGIGHGGAARIRDGAADSAVGGGLREGAGSQQQRGHQGKAIPRDGGSHLGRSHRNSSLYVIVDASRTGART